MCSLKVKFFKFFKTPLKSIFIHMTTLVYRLMKARLKPGVFSGPSHAPHCSDRRVLKEAATVKPKSGKRMQVLLKFVLIWDLAPF